MNKHVERSNFDGYRLKYLCRTINVITHRLDYQWLATSNWFSTSRESHKVIINLTPSVHYLVMNGIIIGKYEEIFEDGL